MKIAFIIPIHLKHYHYIYNLIDIILFNNINIDIYLVFSSYDDYNMFVKKDKIKEIIIPSINTNNIVTYKKFFALQQLQDNINYEYFIVCDAEITIIPENFTETNILYKIIRFYENEIVYCGQIQNITINNITKCSSSLICSGPEIERITKNYSLYFWWYELPVYKREHLSNFFSKFNYDNIDWFCFDHKVYLTYLITYHNFNIVNLTDILPDFWSLEIYDTTDIKNLYKLKSNKYGFSFITHKFYNIHKDFFNNEGCFLLYHLDR